MDALIFSSDNDRSSFSSSTHNESKPVRWRETQRPIAAAILLSFFWVQHCNAELIPHTQIKSFDVPDAYETRPQDINNSLTIVGQAYGAESKAFVYRNRVLDTSTNYRYYGNNDRGQIVGIEFRPTPGGYRAEIPFVKTGNDFVYPSVPGIDNFSPVAINDNGVMIGKSGEHVVIVKGDEVNLFFEDWEDVDPRDEGGIHGSAANSINNNDVAVGSYVVNGGGQHGFIYDSKQGTLDSVVHPSGEDTDPRGINNWGLVVGTHYIDDQTYQGFAYFDGKFIPVEVGKIYTSVTGVNDWGFITGSYRDSWQEKEHGYVAHILPFIFWDQIN